MTRSQCDALAERFPEMRWGWTMVLQGKDHKHLIRTDATAFSTLHNNKSTHHTSEDFRILRYCWNLMALDVGHNSVDSLDFLYDLPDLRVLILACNNITDITPLSSLRNLEYAELFKNKITDLTPLSGLDHLLDLNLCFNKISDWTPLYGLTQMTRLWVYRSCWYDRSKEMPKAEALALQEALPQTQVDYTHYSTAGTWRYINQKTMHPHYKVITQIFGENSAKPGTGYVPFEDSFPVVQDPEPAVPADAAEEPVPQQDGLSFMTIRTDPSLEEESLP